MQDSVLEHGVVEIDNEAGLDVSHFDGCGSWTFVEFHLRALRVLRGVPFHPGCETDRSSSADRLFDQNIASANHHQRVRHCTSLPRGMRCLTEPLWGSR